MIKNGDNLTDEYAKINPFRKVPAATLDGKPMNESLAIMRYLARTVQIDDHWYPKVWNGRGGGELKGYFYYRSWNKKHKSSKRINRSFTLTFQNPEQQLKVDEYLDWQHLNTRANCAMYFRTKWLVPILTGKPVDPKKEASFKKRMEQTLDEIETVWLDGGNKKFICGGDKPSAADIWACCELEQPSMAGYDVRKDRKILAAYMQRVKDELNPFYDEAHKIVYQMVEKFGGDIPGQSHEPKAKL